MTETTIQRTLVKSPPELWAELSDADALARHLEDFGEIRITRKEPETTVAWEGDRASGTVTIEPTGWGTRVVLTAAERQAAAQRPPESAPAVTVAAPPAQEDEEQTAENPGPEPGVLDGPPARRGLLARLAFWRRRGRPRSPAQRAADAEHREQRRMAAGEPPARLRAGADAPSELAVAVAEAERGAADVAPRRREPELAPGEAETVLVRALDALGQAHHRPFSRE